MWFEQGHALIVGVDSYPNAPRLNVPMTASDAQEVAAVLRDPRLCGYPDAQVTLLTGLDATRAAVLDSLDRLAAMVAEGDTIFVFYAGHGIYGEDGTYYLTTSDVQLAGERGKREVMTGTSVGERELLEKLQAIKAGRMLLIFNACHAGEISPTLGDDRDEQTAGQNPPEQTAAALLATGSGRVIITACRPNQYSFVGSGARTIFGQTLIDGLRGQGLSPQGGSISAFDLYNALYFGVHDAVQRTVPEETRRQFGGTQEPELTVIKGVGPFAVALYQGPPVLGETRAAPPPREFTEEESRRALRQLIQAGRDVNQAGRDNFAGATFGGGYTAGDQINAQGSQGLINQPSGPVSQNWGSQRTIDTGGGNYVEGNQAQHGVNISGGTVSGNVIGTNTGSVAIGTGGQVAGGARTVTLAEAQERLQTAVEQARQRGDDDLADELESVALKLTQAARIQGDTARRQQKLLQAQQEIEGLAARRPAARSVAEMLRELSR